MLLLVTGLHSCTDNKEKETSYQQFTLLSSVETGLDFSNTIHENIFTHENVLMFEYYYNGGELALPILTMMDYRM